MPGPLSLRYAIRVAQPQAHLLEVELVISAPSGTLPSPLVLFLPTWAPGSYLIREYARHIEGLQAEDDEHRLATCKVRKNAWAVAISGQREIKVRYRIYANELSVRTNHVDATHAFWNGPSTYLVPEYCLREGLRAEVHPHMPATWSIGTGLPPAPGRPGVYATGSLDELMDCPFECGVMEALSFRLWERPHEFWVWKNRHASAADWNRLLDDTRAIVETEAALLAGERDPAEVLPYERYAFLWQVSPRGRGGLEHANSSALLVSPSSFMTRIGYLDVLSLVAHEFLHLWNVKRIRPEGLWPYSYEAENYTRLLWWFEGGTSYFDWRILRLARLATPREYADHLAGELSRLADTPGARAHPLSEASFDAWIKAYRPDENSINSTVSYYLKGEVVCALFDIEIRSRTQGQRSLDDVLRHLWRVHGRIARPVPEGAMPGIFREVTGVNLDDLFERWVDTCGDLDVAGTLAKVGLRHERKPQPRHANGTLGAKVRHRGGKLVVDALYRDGAAMRGGLESGDELVAVGGRKVDDGIDAALHPFPPGSSVDVVVCRDGWLENLRVTLDPPALGDGRLLIRDDATSAQLALLDGWLGGGTSSTLRGL